MYLHKNALKNWQRNMTFYQQIINLPSIDTYWFGISTELGVDLFLVFSLKNVSVEASTTRGTTALVY
jgi:hypothetical protein